MRGYNIREDYISMNKIIFILAVIGFLIGVYKIEIYLIHKSMERFRELKKAYIDLEKTKKELYNLLKSKELQ